MVEKRKVVEVFPAVRKLWNEWELRALVLVSLALQVALVLVGSRRKYIASNRLRIFTWCAYLMADWVATVALGVLSSSQGGDELMAFWAPFLLLHLGGPDTITAFSFADNELWIRHLLGVSVQTSVTIYIIIMSWRTSSWLSFLTIPMLLPGIIKYGERSWVLRSANRDQFRESGVRTLQDFYEGLRVTFLAHRAAIRFIDAVSNKKSAEPDSAILANSDSDIVTDVFIDAHEFFEIFKVLFVDLILGLGHRSKSLEYMKSKGSKSVFKVIEVELGFAYDTFYTKAPINYTSWGLFSRFLTSSLTIIVFVMFSIIISVTSHKYHTVDMVITLVLFGGAIILEIYSFLVSLSSDWTNLWLTKHSKTRIFKVISCLQFHKKDKSRWSRSMCQYNLLSFSLNQMRKPTGILRLVPRRNKRLQKWLTEKMENVRQLKIRIQVSDNLVTLIFNHFRAKSQNAINIARLCTFRGDGVLEKYGFLEELSWTTDVEFDRSILIWHVATDICYCSDTDKIDSISKEMSKQLADYVLYLLVICPFMLPIGMGMLRFRDSCAEAVNIFKREETLEWKDDEEDSLEFRSKLLSRDWTESADDQVMQKSVLKEASKLAKYLEEKMSDKKTKWEMVSNVWVEILGYAANQCRGFYHAEKLAEGGELLTHVWFLMAHLGITQRYQD